MSVAEVVSIDVALLSFMENEMRFLCVLTKLA